MTAMVPINLMPSAAYTYSAQAPVSVFRYLDARYVDAFVASGEIRLSSFAKFAAHENAELRDGKEGANIIYVIGKNSTTIQARADVFDYIERFYNPRRRHSTLGLVSPDQYEKARPSLG